MPEPIIRPSETLLNVLKEAQRCAVALRDTETMYATKEKELSQARRAVAMESYSCATLESGTVIRERLQLVTERLSEAESAMGSARVELESASAAVKESFDAMFRDSAFRELVKHERQEERDTTVLGQMIERFTARLGNADLDGIPNLPGYLKQMLNNLQRDAYRRENRLRPPEHIPLQDNMESLLRCTRAFTPQATAVRMEINYPTRAELAAVGFAKDEDIVKASLLFYIYGIGGGCDETKAILQRIGFPSDFTWANTQSSSYRKHEAHTLRAEGELLEPDERLQGKTFGDIRQKTQQDRWTNLVKRKLWRLILTKAGWEQIVRDRLSVLREAILSSVELADEIFREIDEWADYASDDRDALVFLVASRLWIFLDSPEPLKKAFNKQGFRNTGANNFVQISLFEERDKQIQSMRFTSRSDNDENKVEDEGWGIAAFESCRSVCQIPHVVEVLDSSLMHSLFHLNRESYGSDADTELSEITVAEEE